MLLPLLRTRESEYTTLKKDSTDIEIGGLMKFISEIDELKTGGVSLQRNGTCRSQKQQHPLKYHLARSQQSFREVMTAKTIQLRTKDVSSGSFL